MSRWSSNPDGSMTFLEHLDELRLRLIRILIAAAVGVAIAFPFRKWLYNVLLTPQNMRVQNMLAEGAGWLRDLGLRPRTSGFLELWLRSQASDETPFIPNFRSPMEPFTALFRLCLLAGLLLASPFIMYQIWAFILPALKAAERRIAVRLGFVLGIFFLMGAAFAFFLAAPLLLEVSANLWRGEDIQLKPENLWTFNDYLGFLIQLILAFGIAFELPLVMAFLARMGIVEVDLFRRKRRIAFFILVIAAAVLTPGDIVPMTMMAAPLLGLYEFGIVLASLAARRNQVEVELPVNGGDS